MKRKVSRIGSSTLMISLPSKWVKRYGVNKGDELEIIEDKDKLIIATEIKVEHLKKELDISKFGKFRKNYISHLYQRGFDEVDIRFENREILNMIKDRVNQLLGFEVIEQGESYCIIKNIAGGLDHEFDTILRKIFLMLIDMTESSYNAIKSGEYERLNEIKDLEKMNNKFTDFCIRILNKKGYPEVHKTHFLYVTTRELEKLADTVRDICNLFIDAKKGTKIKGEILDIFEEATKYLRIYYELFYKFDPNKATYLEDKKREMVNKGQELMGCSKEESILLMHLINLFKGAYELTGPYSCMNL
ncbi:MAG: AbrB/MazE/SpoVT family DNA-binding domain-containing protein [Nanoarchaeota archaeon]|nr:AbrB/MazE/SpoVT family DNA-binding domain-containing protein [Nanoarchaeota archaeon]